MPKMKSHRGARKRFSVTASGRVRHKRANRSHMLEKKSKVRKRRLRTAGTLNNTDARRVKKQLGR